MNIGGLKDFKKPPQSYWMASNSKTGYPELNEDLKADIAIIGGGISGILSAYLLSKEGLKVVVIEAGRILQGATGHTTAKITSQHGLIYSKIKSQMGEEFAKQYAEANEAAIRVIREIVKENGIECDYVSQPAYVYTLQNEYVGKIGDEARVASTLGIKAAYLEEIPLPFPVKAAVCFDDQAQFHPIKFLLPLTEKVTGSGSRIYEKTRIVDIEENGKYVLISEHGKKVTADRVILASHYPCYNKPALYFTRIYSEASYVIAAKIKERYPGGMYIAAEESGHSFRSQISENGELILIGGEQHKAGQGGDTARRYEALIDFAGSTFTLEDIPYRWSTQDCMTLDGLPYVGHFTAKTPNMYIATGYGKWGMTNGMAAAMLLKDLIVKGESPWQEVYNPSRQTIAASAKSFVVENINVAEQLIGGKLSVPSENIGIKPGEGKVVMIDGQKAGAFRDDQGQLHVVNTTCTHMGCELSWNSAEKTWDCPCHGSRFSYEGDVVECPAVRPLDLHKDVNTLEKLFTDQF